MSNTNKRRQRPTTTSNKITTKTAQEPNHSLLKRVINLQKISDKRYNQVQLVRDPATNNCYLKTSIIVESPTEANRLKNTLIKRIKNPNLFYANLADFRMYKSGRSPDDRYKVEALFPCPEYDLEMAVKHRMKQKKYYSNKELTFLLYNLIHGLHHLHKLGFRHSCFSPKWVVKTTTGFAVMDDPLTTFLAKNGFGASAKDNGAYLSPEAYQELKSGAPECYFTSIDHDKNDTFSMGLILLEAALLEGVLDIYRKEGVDRALLESKIQRMKNLFSDNVLFNSTVSRMLDYDAKNRTHLGELVDKLPSFERVKKFFRKKDKIENDSRLMSPYKSVRRAMEEKRMAEMTPERRNRGEFNFRVNHSSNGPRGRNRGDQREGSARGPQKGRNKEKLALALRSSSQKKQAQRGERQEKRNLPDQNFGSNRSPPEHVGYRSGGGDGNFGPRKEMHKNSIGSAGPPKPRLRPPRGSNRESSRRRPGPTLEGFQAEYRKGMQEGSLNNNGPNSPAYQQEQGYPQLRFYSNDGSVAEGSRRPRMSQNSTQRSGGGSRGSQERQRDQHRLAYPNQELRKLNRAANGLSFQNPRLVNQGSQISTQKGPRYNNKDKPPPVNPMNNSGYRRPSRADSQAPRTQNSTRRSTYSRRRSPGISNVTSPQKAQNMNSDNINTSLGAPNQSNIQSYPRINPMNASNSNTVSTVPRQFNSIGKQSQRRNSPALGRARPSRAWSPVHHTTNPPPPNQLISHNHSSRGSRGSVSKGTRIQTFDSTPKSSQYANRAWGGLHPVHDRKATTGLTTPTKNPESLTRTPSGTQMLARVQQGRMSASRETPRDLYNIGSAIREAPRSRSRSQLVIKRNSRKATPKGSRPSNGRVSIRKPVPASLHPPIPKAQTMYYPIQGQRGAPIPGQISSNDYVGKPIFIDGSGGLTQNQKQKLGAGYSTPRTSTIKKVTRMPVDGYTTPKRKEDILQIVEKMGNGGPERPPLPVLPSGQGELNGGRMGVEAPGEVQIVYQSPPNGQTDVPVARSRPFNERIGITSSVGSNTSNKTLKKTKRAAENLLKNSSRVPQPKNIDSPEVTSEPLRAVPSPILKTKDAPPTTDEHPGFPIEDPRNPFHSEYLKLKMKYDGAFVPKHSTTQAGSPSFDKEMRSLLKTTPENEAEMTNQANINPNSSNSNIQSTHSVEIPVDVSSHDLTSTERVSREGTKRSHQRTIKTKKSSSSSSSSGSRSSHTKSGTNGGTTTSRSKTNGERSRRSKERTIPSGRSQPESQVRSENFGGSEALHPGVVYSSEVNRGSKAPRNPARVPRVAGSANFDKSLNLMHENSSGLASGSLGSRGPPNEMPTDRVTKKKSFITVEVINENSSGKLSFRPARNREKEDSIGVAASSGVGE